MFQLQVLGAELFRHLKTIVKIFYILFSLSLVYNLVISEEAQGFVLFVSYKFDSTRERRAVHCHNPVQKGSKTP